MAGDLKRQRLRAELSSDCSAIGWTHACAQACSGYLGTLLDEPASQPHASCLQLMLGVDSLAVALEIAPVTPKQYVNDLSVVQGHAKSRGRYFQCGC